ncbi:phage tail tape measure protein [Roseixanthobacter liquoris]|uniref:phage tail tape measure protein n=1 Tax=Roseixanthobacter liquoris TaxID=3119921 RepID=UPI003726E935
MTPMDGISVKVDADTRPFRDALADSERLARGFASTLGNAFTSIAVKGKDVGDVVEGIGTRLSSLALNLALKPVEQGISNLFSSLLEGKAFARGGVVAEGAVRPFATGGVLQAAGGEGLQVRAFAKGGVVAAPTYFPLGSGAGLMGERGAEAILPLARGADGALGVRTQDGGARSSVTVNVSTPDVGSFRRSDAYLSGLVARAVARAQRGA